MRYIKNRIKWLALYLRTSITCPGHRNQSLHEVMFSLGIRLRLPPNELNIIKLTIFYVTSISLG